MVTLPIHVINAAHVSAPHLAAIERATLEVANMQLTGAWHTPRIRWASYGEQVVIAGGDAAWQYCGAWACHGADPGKPAMAMVSSTSYQDLAMSFSHELFEMIVDPRFTHRIGRNVTEVCDPVTVDWSNSNSTGTMIADFVYPSFYDRRARGHYDWVGAITKPLRPDVGGTVWNP